MVITLTTKQNQVFSSIKSLAEYSDQILRQDVADDSGLPLWEVTEVINELCQKDMLISMQGGRLGLYKNAFEDIVVSDRWPEKKAEPLDIEADIDTKAELDEDEEPVSRPAYKPLQVKITKPKKVAGIHLSPRETEVVEAMREFRSFKAADVARVLDISKANGKFLIQNLFTKNAVKRLSPGTYTVTGGMFDSPADIAETKVTAAFPQPEPMPVEEVEIKTEEEVKELPGETVSIGVDSATPGEDRTAMSGRLAFKFPIRKVRKNTHFSVDERLHIRVKEIAADLKIDASEVVETFLEACIAEYDRQK